MLLSVVQWYLSWVGQVSGKTWLLFWTCLAIDSVEYLSLDVRGTVVYVRLGLAGEIRL